MFYTQLLHSLNGTLFSIFSAPALKGGPFSAKCGIFFLADQPIFMWVFVCFKVYGFMES
jgi:hypothetical protein